jgi:hypothetical protein
MKCLKYERILLHSDMCCCNNRPKIDLLWSSFISFPRRLVPWIFELGCMFECRLRVSYKPWYFWKYIVCYLFPNFKNSEARDEFVDILANHSLILFLN